MPELKKLSGYWEVDNNMPELPEVTTTVKGLQKVLPGLVFTDVWTDLAKKNQTIKQFKNTIKNDIFFKSFKQKVIWNKIINIERRAKNILINIDKNQTILIHLKMTGHLLYGKYIFDKKVASSATRRGGGKIESPWTPDKKEKKTLFDPYNRFIHVVFSLSNGKHLAFCDSRKFGKVTLIETSLSNESIHLKNIGPEPLNKTFTLSEFKKSLLLKPNWKIKTSLMDQSVIAGIGNIYSDEMLWLSSISPESITSKIPSKYIEKLYMKMKEVLTMGIDFGGDSMSDYRNIYGEKGDFQNHHNVYKKKNTVCVKKNCNGVIIRKVINGRSAHFCNLHQKLFN